MDMDIDFVFRIAGIGIIVTVISQLLTRAGRDDIALLATLSGLVVVLMMVVGMISDFFASIRSLLQI
jgi:stage III sporulation protein AC